MTTDSKLDWQPARIRFGQHPPCPIPHPNPATDEEKKEAQAKVVHVRETLVSSWVDERYRSRGCTAMKFFAVKEFPFRVCCEHEILTD